MSTLAISLQTALIAKPGAWPQSPLRANMPDGPGKSFLDQLDRTNLTDWLKALHTQAQTHGLTETQEALDWLAARQQNFTTTELACLTSRVAGFGLERPADNGPDLTYYDHAFLQDTTR